MDQRCYRGNRPAHTTMTMFQTSATRDTRDKPFTSPEKAQYKPHTSHTHTSRGSRMAKPLTRKFGRWRRHNVVWNTSGFETTLVPPQPPVFMPPTLPARLARIWVISPASTVTRKVTKRQSVPSQERTEIPQKTSDGFGHLRVDETNVDGTPEATLERVPCIRYLVRFQKNEWRFRWPGWSR